MNFSIVEWYVIDYRMQFINIETMEEDIIFGTAVMRFLSMYMKIAKKDAHYIHLPQA
tara:strand:- start:467 stop:637 length:171 start_codon:yes stop_codon:yes gene_type:complete